MYLKQIHNCSKSKTPELHNMSLVLENMYVLYEYNRLVMKYSHCYINFVFKGLQEDFNCVWEQHSQHPTKETSSLPASQNYYVHIQTLVCLTCLCQFFHLPRVINSHSFSHSPILTTTYYYVFNNRLTIKSCVNGSIYHLARISQQRWRIHSNIFSLCPWFPQCNPPCPACENREALSCKLPPLSALLCLSIPSVTPCSLAKWLVRVWIQFMTIHHL